MWRWREGYSYDCRGRGDNAAGGGAGGLWCGGAGGRGGGGGSGGRVAMERVKCWREFWRRRRLWHGSAVM